ncbi:hypothetical protein FRX31_005871 [Thalictrum thalictroides]|uniref:Uncharacterized protein n=1 Tax=Thalictrum thalictroides TaxID=46969 RepID=A0A7J6X480_THATH|nr:hypothetical protein FRX31_005871 [Thalictrum thalictroides]
MYEIHQPVVPKRTKIEDGTASGVALDNVSVLPPVVLEGVPASTVDLDSKCSDEDIAALAVALQNVPPAKDIHVCNVNGKHPPENEYLQLEHLAIHAINAEETGIHPEDSNEAIHAINAEEIGIHPEESNEAMHAINAEEIDIHPEESNEALRAINDQEINIHPEESNEPSTSSGSSDSAALPMALDIVLAEEDGSMADDETGSNNGGPSDSSAELVAVNDGEHALLNEPILQLENLDGSLADDEASSNSGGSSDSSAELLALNIGEHAQPNDALLQLNNLAIQGAHDPNFVPNELDEEGYMADDEASSESSGGPSDSSAPGSTITSKGSTGSTD